MHLLDGDAERLHYYTVMPMSVFLLGAGASKDSGAPLMAEFLGVARNLRRSGLPTEFHKVFDLVFNAMGSLQAVHSKSTLDFTNVESLFSAFEVGKTLNRLPGYSDDAIDEVIEALKKVIVVTLERTLPFDFKDGTIISPPSYERFVSLLKRLIELLISRNRQIFRIPLCTGHCRNCPTGKDMAI